MAAAIKDIAVIPVSTKLVKEAGMTQIYKPIVLDPKILPTSRPKKTKDGLPKVGCMPGCTHDHVHDFDYDYKKNHKDALN